MRRKERFSTEGNYTALAETETKRVYILTSTLAQRLARGRHPFGDK